MNSYIEDISHLNTHDISKLATSYVASQLKQKCAIVKKIDNIKGRKFIIADNKINTHEISIIVRSRRKGSWHSSIEDMRLCEKPEVGSNYWFFVNLTDLIM